MLTWDAMGQEHVCGVKSSLVCHRDGPTRDHPGHETHSRNTACHFERALRGQLPALTFFPSHSSYEAIKVSDHPPFVRQRGAQDESRGCTEGSLVTLPSLPPLCVALLSVSNLGVRSGRQTTRKQLKIERPQSPELGPLPQLHSAAHETSIAIWGKKQ